MSGYWPQEEERIERKQVDWSKVHVEADRRPPLHFIPRPGRWLNVTRNKRKNDG